MNSSTEVKSSRGSTNELPQDLSFDEENVIQISPKVIYIGFIQTYHF
jgi:hypothetical protein